LIHPATPQSTAALVDFMLAGLASSHGKVLVERAFGLWLTARDGLSWPEMFDLLSCDDDVVDEAFGSHAPPCRRLPGMRGRLFARDAEAMLAR
jgi:hypothetical protein